MCCRCELNDENAEERASCKEEAEMTDDDWEALSGDLMKCVAAGIKIQNAKQTTDEPA